MDTVHMKLKASLIICDIEVVSLSNSSIFRNAKLIRRSEYCGVPFSLSGTNSGTPISLGNFPRG